MKLAYVIYPEAIVINKSNGIRNQAVTWKKQLESEDGCQVDLINPWDAINWAEYDAIHVFGGNQWLGFIPDLAARNDNIVFSPILDCIEPLDKIKFQASLGFKGYHHPQNMYRTYLKIFKKILVRSQYEADYFIKAYRCPEEQIAIVPISYDITDDYVPQEKENSCLHISAVYQERKNVQRLVEASKKYNFPLYLGGNYGNAEQKAMVESWIDGTPLIKLLGFISDEKALELYRRCKVFALPSINEGVGIVALNAAVQGANVVITKVGGPKEYYNGMAYEVNPYDVDDIGKSVMAAMGNDNKQPQLREHIIAEYSTTAIRTKLINVYQSLK